MGLRSLFNRKKKLLKKTAIASSPSPVAPHLLSGAHLADELQHVFKKFDVNGDGRISASELGSIMKSLGHSASDDEVQKMIHEVDSDGDGHISLDEFIELNTKGVDNDEVLENLKDAFSVFDIDGNGSITAEELHMVMASLGDQCSMDECRKMIGGVDSDGDGMINFEEFRTMMMGKE